MAHLVDKLKSHKALHEGAKLPAGVSLKEDNPEQGTVDLASLSGKSESRSSLSAGVDSSRF